MSIVETLLKALAKGERWITVRPNGPGTEGHPLLIKDQPDGSAKVIGGAGGKMNHLRLTGVRSEAEYKDGLASRSKEHRERRKRQAEQDRRLGIAGGKKKAKEALKAQVGDHRAQFIQTVADALGWTDEQMRFPEEKYQNATEGARNAAAKQHARALHKRAKEAVDHQRKRLLNDADARAEAGLGEVALTNPAPDQLSVQDLDPVQQSTAGLGFAPKYDNRAEKAGLTKEERAQEAAAARPAPEPGRPDPAKVAEDRRVTGEAIAKELEAIKDPGPPVDTGAAVDAKTAVALLKAEKALKQVERSAREQGKRIDTAKEPVEPQAFVLEVGKELADSAVLKDLEDDLRTLATRGFLDEAARSGGTAETVRRHVSVGAYNAVNALALAAGGAALLDRSAVDVLGIAGSAQVLARRLAADLTEEEIGHIREAMSAFHVKHYMELSDEALREARAFHEMAHEIEVGEAANGADLATAQELNAKRREAVANAERVLGTALGEMEANAALVTAFERPKRDSLDVSLGGVSVEAAITRVRALGLQRGEYQLKRIGASTILTLNGAGMDRVAAPVAREDLERTRNTMAIINGDRDEDGWLPGGVTRRPEAAMQAPPGSAPRLARPIRAVGPDGDARAAVEDYVGARAADGDSPAAILAGLMSEDTLQRSGNRGGVMDAINAVCPQYDGAGNLVRVETYAPEFERLAEQHVERAYGGRLAPLHRQGFPVDQVAVDALHTALAQVPEGTLAFKPVGELTAQDMGALRDTFAREYGSSDPAAKEMRTRLDHLDAHEPAKETDGGLFGPAPNPEHADWLKERNGLAEELNKKSMTWGKYLTVMGSPANAYAALQDVVRGKVVGIFATEHNRAHPDGAGALKLGRTVIRHDLGHLDALDPVAREARLAKHAALVDSLRERKGGGQYAAGSVADKLDAARAHEEAFEQNQLGMFGDLMAAPAAKKPGAGDAPGGQGDEGDMPLPADSSPLAVGERHTIGHAAERQLAAMLPIVGHNFRAGQGKVPLWSPSMDGKYVARQRAIKLIEANRRVEMGLGVGSGKTSIALAGFTHLHGQGKAKKAIFAVPSIVQGQFHGEALTLLEPGKFKWHCDTGATREQRIAHYKNPETHFSVVTHQALRDDLLHLASEREGTSRDAVADKLDAMNPQGRAAYMRELLDAEGIPADYLGVDEGHNLLNRAGKDNSRMANVLDGVAHSMGTYVSMTADPVKNDPSEAFDVLRKMDPQRYHDQDAFMRRYGVDTPASRDELKREMARHFYTGRIDPGVKANRREVSVELHPEQHAQLDRLDQAAAKARLARAAGRTDVDALRTLSPNSFEGVDPARHAEVAANLNKSIGIVLNSAIHHAINGGAKTDAVAKIAHEERGRQGVVFANRRERVDEIAKRLEAEGHRVVVLTGGDSSKEKDRKKAEFQAGQHDVIVMSDAGAVGANLQKGKWQVQYDTPNTAMLHGQRQGRIHRMGQTEDVNLYDLVANHPAERRARKRLADKYELRDVLTSPLEGLDDTGLAGYLARARAGRLEEAEPLHPAKPHEAAAVEPEPEEQASLF